jgi:hypothetical protein
VGSCRPSCHGGIARMAKSARPLSFPHFSPCIVEASNAFGEGES